ncbi:MAG TPA: tyrosinase family protein [Solirubrobacteraceae bacterium]|jgi:tyrosinase
MADAPSSAHQAPVAPALARYTRCEVRSPQGQQALAAYAKAVGAMKARPKDNQTSWAYQAAMHGTYNKPLAPLWNGCKHFSWWFVAWHRMFVYYFEQIVRAAVVETGGPANWALPYWDYELGGEHASIPDAFRKADGGANPLYVAQRAPGINEGARLKRAVTTSRFALARPDFIGSTEFGGGEAPPTPQFWEEAGELEQTPHNVIHDALGGRGGWMSDPDRAAQDPIFWLHHAQIDRLWARWNSEGHANPTHDKTWSQQSFEFFGVDRKLVSKRCIEVVDTVAGLEYDYDRLKP